MTPLIGLEEFTAEAREFVGKHAQRRTDTFRWGEGSDVIPFFEGIEDDETALKRGREWARTRYDAGYGWITGPATYGGRELPPAYELAYRIIESEHEVADTSHLELGWGMVGPTILTWAPDALKEEVLRPLYRGDFVACQLFSEPEAGSDLAGVRTTAVRDGDEWVVNGQKVWTSDAQHSQIGLLLARTNPEAPKHKGLTMFLIDMSTPGVDVRPLRQMSGTAHFNEVFFDDVRIPDSRRLGDVDNGWRVALTTLMNERGSVGAGPPNTMAALHTDRLVELVKRQGKAADPLVRQEVARVVGGFTLARLLDQGIRERLLQGGEPGPEASVLKLMFARNLINVAAFATSVLGPAATADTGEWGTFSWSQFRLATPALRILGGTEEIMKNILAERVLGLPKD
jgi:acyl-CoA dehydrogenase